MILYMIYLYALVNGYLDPVQMDPDDLNNTMEFN